MRDGEHTAPLLCIILWPMDSSFSSFQKVFTMKLRTASFSLALMLSLASVSSVSSAGCVKGAVVGGVAGHVAGHHSLLGAAAGCAIGHHMSKKKAREQAAADARARQPQPQAAPVRR
jgi:Na+/phosphate symporter